MNIFDLIRSNPWLILVIFWGISSLGGVMQKAAKKAEQQRKRQAGRRSAETEGMQAPSRREVSAPGPQQRPQRERPSADDIAAEIRRAMGQRAEQDEERPQPVRRAAPTPPPIRPEPVQVEVVTERRKSLSEEMDEKEAKGKRDRAREDREREIHLGRLEGRDAHLGERISERHIRPEFAGKRTAGSVRRGTPLVDLSRPAAAFVSMEVFGPPVGMRGPDGIGRPRG